MNSRERVLVALSHKEPDRVPVDLGSTWITTTTVPVHEHLKRCFGIEGENTILSRVMQVCKVDERILEILHVDTRGVFFGRPELERNQVTELGENAYRDSWGIEWHRPASCYYYELRKPPLSGEIALHDIVTHSWPDPHDPGYTRGLRERVKKQRASTDCALVLNLPFRVVECSQVVRGFEDWFVDLILQPRLIEALMDAVTESLIGTVEDVLDEVGDLVDVVSLSDDMGHQDRPCVRPALYRKLIKPRHARLMGAIKSRTAAPIMLHTCGSVYDLLEDLIELGVDALNPVQTNAAKMEPERLKSEYGERLSFWGAIDTSRVLPFGTQEDVEQEVLQKIRVFAPGGGFVLSTVHNIQPIVPVENILSLFEAAHSFGRYPTTEGPGFLAC